MRIVPFLLATSSLAFAGAALADNNEAWLDQSGSGNSALIRQTGADNDAGSTGRNIRQVDLRNQLTILQSGNGNAAGLGTNPDAADAGIHQISNRDGAYGNIIDITQSSDNNTVGAVGQTSAGTNTTLQRNTVAIEQAGDGGNTVGSVTQWRQSSRGNMLDVMQTGSGNTLARVIQASPTTGGGNNRNEAMVNMSGRNNGNAGALGGAAAMAGATSSTIIQGDFGIRAARSTATLNISGDRNQFGVTQYGDSNTVGRLTITGDDNEVGTYQNGNGNTITAATVAGAFNTIGAAQLGDLNLAALDVRGDGNGVLSLQQGLSNEVSVMITGNDNGWNQSLTGVAGLVAGGHPSGIVQQIGDLNLASLTVTGNANAFALVSTGDGNVITGVQTGDANHVAVVQGGNDNTAHFSQIGNGNNAGIAQ